MVVYNTFSNEELVALLRQDNEPAFKELYDRFWELLFTRAYNFLRNEDSAKDCVQEVFIWLWQHRQSVHIDHVHNYLHQAVRFQALKAVKEQRSVINLDERLSHFTGIVLQDDNLQYKELKALLLSLIDTLPADQQELFLLNREQGLTYKQIAAIKNISVKTVEKKMSLALKTLRPGLDKAILVCVITGIVS